MPTPLDTTPRSEPWAPLGMPDEVYDNLIQSINYYTTIKHYKVKVLEVYLSTPPVYREPEYTAPPRYWRARMMLNGVPCRFWYNAKRTPPRWERTR